VATSIKHSNIFKAVHTNLAPVPSAIGETVTTVRGFNDTWFWVKPEAPLWPAEWEENKIHQKEMVKWCLDSFGNFGYNVCTDQIRWAHENNVFYFTFESDRSMFLLRWQ
jgi:hypothetical protein